MTAPFDPHPRVESPCIKVCELDAHDVCIGCGRTLQEIAAWSQLSGVEQEAVRRAAAKRLAQRSHGPTQCS